MLDMDVPVKRKAPLLVVSEDPAVLELFASGAPYLERLANVSGIEALSSGDAVPKQAVTAVVEGAELFIPLESLVDSGSALLSSPWRPR